MGRARLHPELKIDLKSPQPAYRQIVDGLRALLVEEAVAPGQTLPPVRRLAIDLGVHFNTVAEAYRELAREGWLDVRRRSGAKVLERKPPRKSDRLAVPRFRQMLRELIARGRASGIQAAELSRVLRAAAEGVER